MSQEKISQKNISHNKTSYMKNVREKNFIQTHQIGHNSTQTKCHLEKQTKKMTQETQCQIEKCHRARCRTDKMAHDMTKTHLRRNTIFEKCHRRKRHSHTPS